MHNLWCYKIETQNQELISSFFSYVMRDALARFDHRKTGPVTILYVSYLYFTVSTTVAFTFERSTVKAGRTPIQGFATWWLLHIERKS